MSSADESYSFRNSSENRQNRTPFIGQIDDLDEAVPPIRDTLYNVRSEHPALRTSDHDDSDDLSYSPPLPETPSVGQVESELGRTPQEESRWRTLAPKSWGSLFGKWRKGNSTFHQGSFEEKILPNGTQVSPPVSPLLNRRHESSCHETSDSHKPLITDSSTNSSRTAALLPDLLEGSELTSIHPAEYYAEKLEVYQRKYSYMKSWPGLLRLLAGLQLLFGGMVFACVCAYIQKDSEWFNMYGQSYLGGYSPSGYNYRGPMTPFVMAVTGLAWLVTIILLVLGLTMYYRTILLDSHWWPLTEGIINVALFLLYMSAGIVYVNDLNRGGLCYMTVGINPLMSSLCRVEGGQMAGTAFIFINMFTYLLSFLVCLKMWRQEATRQEMEAAEREAAERQSLEPPSSRTVYAEPKGLVSGDLVEGSVKTCKRIHFAEAGENPKTLNRAIPTGYVPKPRVIADYIMKYPVIRTVEEREKYKAVFHDQYQEYKELHGEISATMSKFSQLDDVMRKLLHDSKDNYREQERIHHLLKKYKLKKNDPAFLEKKERCEYLKAKLKHIKSRILEFDRYQ